MLFNSNRKMFTTLIVVILLISSPFTGEAHSGRTDSNGGHRDNKNKSGLGSYHYHHGMGPHLHPNGVCPYGSSNTSTTNKPTSTTSVPSIKSSETSYQLGYNKGYEDAKNEQSKNSESADSTIRQSDYTEGYEKGYQEGLAWVEKTKTTVKEKGTTDGYQYGYAGEKLPSHQYTGYYTDAYEEGYKKGYLDGVKARETEIKQVKIIAKSAGTNAGYNEEPMTFSYDGNHPIEYRSSFKEGYTEGQKKLKIEQEQIQKEYYIYGMIGLMKPLEVEHNTLQNTANTSFDEGEAYKENLLSGLAPFGSRIKDFALSAKDKKHIIFGLGNLTEETLIRVNNSWHWNVNEIYLDVYHYFKRGFNDVETTHLIQTILTPSIYNAYELQKTTYKQNNETTYAIKKLKLNNSSLNNLPNDLYFISSIQDGETQQVIITTRIPYEINRLRMTL